jgi:predicted acylesterase/phospholipase RssA
MATSKSFSGLAAFRRFPLFLISLSGGGFRAALYHAGVLRALHESGILVRSCDSHRVLVNAVSGGAIPALIWDSFLRSSRDGLWPEQKLLSLITSVPCLGGKFNWKLRRPGAWERFLKQWWERDAAPPSLFEEINPVTMIELLDYLTGTVHVLSGTCLNVPNREFFKSGESRTISFGDETRATMAPFAMAKATALPGYFPRWKLKIERTQETHQFLDAGLVDNLAAQPFIPFFGQPVTGEEIPDKSVWFVSNAGAQLSVPRSSINFLGTTVDRLSISDRLSRYTGTLARPTYESMILKLVSDHTNFGVTGVRIGTLAYREDPWLVTTALPDQGAVRAIKTTLSRMRREDAICVMLQGAQAASSAMNAPEEARQRLKASLMSLRTNQA